MSISNHTYQARATASAERRKGLVPMLIVICVIGIVFGYFFGAALGAFFFPYITTPPAVGTGDALDTFEAMKNIFLAASSLIGMVFWPGVFAGLYYLRWRKQERAEAALIADQDTAVRKMRVQETERRIQEAKAAGAFDKFGEGT